MLSLLSLFGPVDDAERERVEGLSADDLESFEVDLFSKVAERFPEGGTSPRP